MAEMKKEPYNAMVDKKFIGEWTLDDGNGGWIEKDGIIVSCKRDSVTSEKGTVPAVVAQTTLGKPFVINGTNRDVLVSLSGSKYPADWNNIPVTFWVKKDVRAFGKTVAGLRIKKCANVPQAAPVKPTLELNSTVFTQAKAAVEAGTYDLAKLKLYYTITPEVQIALNL